MKYYDAEFVSLFRTYVYLIFPADFFYILVNRFVFLKQTILRWLQPNARAFDEKWRGQTNAALCFTLFCMDILSSN